MISTSVSIYFGTPQPGHTIKVNYKITRDMHDFDLLGKGVGLVSAKGVSPPRFVYDFSRVKYLSS